MKKRYWSLLVVGFLLVFFPPVVKAVSLSFSSPSEINEEPFYVEVNINGASNGQNYLRVDLYKDQTSKYFGETFNGAEWVSSSDGKAYYPILISSSSAQAKVQARVGSPSSAEYPGTGSYKLRVRRYTASGAYASSDSSSPSDIVINYLMPTPTSEPTKQMTPTKTPTLIPTKFPTPKIETTKEVVANRTEISEKEDGRIYPTAVLGEKSVKKDDISPTVVIQSNDIKSFDLLPYIFFIAGGGFVLICAILTYLNWRKNRLEEI